MPSIHGQIASVVTPTTTHSSVYQSIIYPHTQQYQNGALYYPDPRTSLHGQHPESPSLYRLPSSDTENRNALPHHDEYIGSLHSSTSDGRFTSGNGETLETLASSPQDDSICRNTTSNEADSPSHDSSNNLGRAQPSTDPAVWRPY